MPNEKEVEVTRLFRECEKASEKVVVHAGGAGSSKSYSLCQFFIFRRLLVIKNYKLLVLRKTRHSNKLSIYETFLNVLKFYDLYEVKNHNKSDLIYYFPSLNSYVRFAGLEDREYIKSTEWHDIWDEEANEFNHEDLIFQKTRLYRGSHLDGHKPRIWMSFNPVDCWIFDIEGDKDVKFIYSNYKDNPFMNEESKKTLEALKDEDETYYKIYALGQRAKPLNVIYKPYIIDKIYPETFDVEIYGLDFGFNNPAALLHIGIRDQERYLTELLYQTHLTNQDLIEKMLQLIPEQKRGYHIYADSAEPARIEEIGRAGFNVMAADKSVEDGIDYCKRKKYHSKIENVNLNREREFYKYAENRNGDVMDYPVKYKDHLMDCKRYADYTYGKQGDLRIL